MENLSFKNFMEMPISHAGWNEALQNYSEQYTYNLDNVFDSLIGGIFVM